MCVSKNVVDCVWRPLFRVDYYARESTQLNYGSDDFFIYDKYFEHLIKHFLFTGPCKPSWDYMHYC
jgi:hypothetical protein